MWFFFFFFFFLFKFSNVILIGNSISIVDYIKYYLSQETIHIFIFFFFVKLKREWKWNKYFHFAFVLKLAFHVSRLQLDLRLHIHSRDNIIINFFCFWHKTLSFSLTHTHTTDAQNEQKFCGSYPSIPLLIIHARSNTHKNKKVFV